LRTHSQDSHTKTKDEVISFGSIKIQFWLAAPRQCGLQLKELSVWLLLAAVTAFQFFLIYRLLK